MKNKLLILGSFILVFGCIFVGWKSDEIIAALTPYNLSKYDTSIGRARINNLNPTISTDSTLYVNGGTNEITRGAPLSTILGNYATTGQLGNYATISQLSNYATNSNLTTLLSGKANNNNTITINGNAQQLGNNPSFTVGTSAASYTNNATRPIVTNVNATGVQISATRATRVSYTVTHTIALTLLLTSGSSQVFLEISPTNTSGSWVSISQAGYADGVSVAVAITKSNTNNVQGEVPAGWFVRLRSVTSGAGNATFTSGQEVQY